MFNACGKLPPRSVAQLSNSTHMPPPTSPPAACAPGSDDQTLRHTRPLALLSRCAPICYNGAIIMLFSIVLRFCYSNTV
jgi:hypothetical protein